MYQKFLKEVNGDHKFLRCTDLRDNNFEVMHSAIAAETVKSKPTGNDSVFITYSSTINFSVKWLGNSGYLIRPVTVLCGKKSNRTDHEQTMIRHENRCFGTTISS